MKKFIICNIFVFAVLLGFSGCIKNDIPYPHLNPGFLVIEAQNQIQAAKINAVDSEVTLYLPETENIRAVKLSKYELTEDAQVVSPNLDGPLDLAVPQTVKIHLYYDYEWTIKAEQSVERYFTVENQIGESVIDVPGRRVLVQVPESQDLSKVKVTSLKLGPKDITGYTPNIEGTVVDFSKPYKLSVNYFGLTETWNIYVERTEVSVSIGAVDAWTQVIWVHASGQDGKNNGVQYRAAGAEKWIDVPQDCMTFNGGAFTARISGLMPMADYEVRAYSDEEFTGVEKVTTENILEIPNMNFDMWHMDGKVWDPWGEGEAPFWDTGNSGAVTLGDSNSVPCEETCDGKPGYSAKLQTRFAGIAAVGKLAAGNLFTGEFLRVDGTNGILNFGREFSGRPTKLKGYYKYKSTAIDYTNKDLAHMKGQKDTGTIYIALTDWNAPLEIRTNPKNPQYFDKNAPEIIGFGELILDKDVEEFTEFTIDIKYKSTNRKPKYILIVCSASRYGDYFTGGAGTVMTVDNFKLEWD